MVGAIQRYRVELFTAMVWDHSKIWSGTIHCYGMGPFNAIRMGYSLLCNSTIYCYDNCTINCCNMVHNHGPLETFITIIYGNTNFHAMEWNSLSQTKPSFDVMVSFQCYWNRFMHCYRMAECITTLRNHHLYHMVPFTALVWKYNNHCYNMSLLITVIT